MAHAHPQAFRLVFGRAMLPVPALRGLDAPLGALERGLDREAAAEMVRTLLAYAGGWAMLELSAAQECGATELEQIVALTRALPPETPTSLVEVARLMACCDMDRQFELGLDLIMAGLEGKIAGRGPTHWPGRGGGPHVQGLDRTSEEPHTIGSSERTHNMTNIDHDADASLADFIARWRRITTDDSAGQHTAAFALIGLTNFGERPVPSTRLTRTYAGTDRPG